MRGSAVVISMIGAVAATALLLSAPGHAQTPTAATILRVVPPSESVATSKDQVDISINVENVTDLAGFQFVLAVDPAVFKPLAARKTQFIGQTGREIVCGDPTIESAAVRLACVTLRPTPPGVNGSGAIATITLKPVAKGNSELALRNVKLVRPDGTEIPNTVANARIAVTGSSWWTTMHILIVIGSAAAVAVLVAAAVAWRVRARGAVTTPATPGGPGAGA